MISGSPICEWPIDDSYTFIDEAYKDYNNRKHKMFSDQEHLFFSTKGHNGNDINLVVQNPARLDLVIREMTDTFFYVKKIEIPLIWRPLLFVLDAYLCEDDFKRRHMDKDALYNLSYKLFRPKVSKAYDTHYFRKECD